MGLLLAALDEVSTERRQRYEQALAGVHGPGQLVELAAQIFAEDLDTGDAKLLVEMIAGTASMLGLAAEVKVRFDALGTVRPGCVNTSVGRLAVWGAGHPRGGRPRPGGALSWASVLLSHLDGDRAPALALFDQARRLAPLLALMAGPSGRHRSFPLGC